jgi:hypothetical protein
MVSPELKTALTDLARQSGRSISSEAGYWLDRALAYEKLEARTGQSIEEIARIADDAAFMRRGYTKVRTLQGTAWLRSDSPGLERFLPWPNEAQPEPVEVPPLEPLTPEEAAKTIRAMEARIAALEAMVKGAKK